MISKKLAIATAKSRKELRWKNSEITWGALIKKLSTTYRTRETQAEYFQKRKDEQDAIKDIGGFVGGYLKNGLRRNDYVAKRSLITLDADFAPEDFWDQLEMTTDYALACYSTHKHTTSKPRLRLVIPLARTVSAEEYEAIARKLAEEMGIDYFDDTTYEPTRMMYWPSTSSDADYFFNTLEEPFLEPDKILASYDDWKDITTWPRSSRAKAQRSSALEKQSDPLAKEGLIGAFCRTYTIQDAIAKFIPEVYTATEKDNRYTYAKGSTSAGLVIYDDKFAFSNHGTDPASGLLSNAFDLIRIHLFGENDLEAKADTPVNRLPSWQKMMELVQEDSDTKRTIGAERYEIAQAEFQITSEKMEIPESDMEWVTKLKTKKDGSYEPSIDNILIILKNDPLLKEIGAYNEFNDKYEVKRKLPWARSGEYWSDVDDASLRHYLEKVYNIEGRQRILDALIIAMQEHAYHPVREYLNSLKWDGKNRLESLFIDYLGATDNHYTRTVTRKTLVAGAKRIYEPGCKFDHMLTLVGEQGVGKSYLILKLGMTWASDTLTDIRGKDAYEALDGVWIMELSELSAFKKAEREAIKNYISKQTDTYRKAYARNVSVNKRQCIFIGTTNDKEFLNDPTGARRYWVVDTDKFKRKKTVWGDLSQDEVDQIWAEAKHFYESGENIMALDEETYDASIEAQLSHTEENPYAGPIKEFIAKKVPVHWDNYTMKQRQAWMATEDFDEEFPEDKLVERRSLCSMEIWVECFQKDQASLSKMNSRNINEVLDRLEGWSKEKYPSRHGPYGNQRGYIKDDILD